MIFLDTGAFLGRFLQRDQFHEQAVLGWQRLQQERLRCFTSNHVVDEVLTLLGRRAGNDFAVERGKRLLMSTSLEVLRADAEDELAAIRFFERFADQKVSFTDALSFALMRRHSIKKAFTFDSDFRIAGYEIWPEPS